MNQKINMEHIFFPQTYMQIMLAIMSAKNHIEIDYNVVLLGQLLNCCYIAELLTVVKVFDKLIKTAKGIGKILCNMKLDNTEERLKQSVIT
jgi:hypothetical protein